MLTDQLKERLPPTDSRLRPDQRALENGDTEIAIKEKNRLEESQRLRRREYEKSGKSYYPAYYDLVTHEITGEKIWKFNGKYWLDRANKDWSKLSKIYE